MIDIHLIGDSQKSNSIQAYNLEKLNHFGKKEGETIEYSPFETMYLKEIGKAKIIFNSKQIDLRELDKKFSKKDKKFSTKYAVYKDLRKKGYIVKTALKFGAEFRVYEKGKKKTHAKWIIFTDSEKNVNSWHDFSAKNRVANSTNKKLLLAIVDDEKDILYYEINWLKI